MPLLAAAVLSEAPCSPGVHVTLKRPLLPRFSEQNGHRFSLIVAQLVSLSVCAAESCLPNHVPPSLSLFSGLDAGHLLLLRDRAGLLLVAHVLPVH